MTKRDKKVAPLLQKPVHVAILRPTHIQKLAKEGKLPQRLLSLATPEQPELPDGKPVPEEKPLVSYAEVARRGSQMRKETLLRTKLRVVHDNVPPIPKDKQPPCDSCKTSACCIVFMVGISPEEYESGLYGDYAVKLTHKDSENIGSGRFSKLMTMRMPSVHGVKEGIPQHYLEGPIGQPCPFLQEDGKCGIYDKRPITCRSYTCIGDERITQDMRDGKVDLEEAIINWMVDQSVE